MFLADARLATATLLLVAIVAALLAGYVEPLLGGAVLLLGYLALLVEATVREARHRSIS
ncbi:hypothetical protein GCM10022626_14470 [[Pseudomonas] carboxydohydrogena]